MIKQFILLIALLLPKVIIGAVTEYPLSLRTGKLNQFVGFATPRPPPPSNGPYVYGSVWASWSAWSFCVNNVRIRVRACNTVRGFSCLGKNQELMECDSNNLKHETRDPEYEVIDPWEDDRREAMRQLYSHDYPSKDLKTRKPIHGWTNFDQTPLHPQGRQTVLVLNNSGQMQKEVGKIKKYLPTYQSTWMDIKNPDGSNVASSLLPLTTTGITLPPLMPNETNPRLSKSAGVQRAFISQHMPQDSIRAAKARIHLPLQHLSPQKSAQSMETVLRGQLLQEENGKSFAGKENSLILLQKPVLLTNAPVSKQPINSMVQIPSGSAQNSEALSATTTAVETSSTPLGPITNPINVVVNSAASEALHSHSSEGSSSPVVSSSEIPLPSPLSLISTSLASLPQISPIMSFRSSPLGVATTISSTAATTAATTSILESMHISVPFSRQITILSSNQTTVPFSQQTPFPFDQQSMVPAAKAINVDYIAEEAFENDEILQEHPELILPQSNVSVKKLNNMKTGRNSMNNVLEKQNRGISRKKPIEYLEKGQKALTEVLPERTIHSPEIKTAMKDDVPVKLAKQPNLLLNGSKMHGDVYSQNTLYSGEVNFQQSVKKDDEDKNSRGKQAFVLKSAIVQSSTDRKNLKDIKRTTTRPFTNFRLEGATFDHSLRNTKEVEQMQKELEKLREMMKVMKDMINSNSKEKAYQKAINLNLVPKGPSTTTYRTTSASHNRNRLILLSMNEKTSAEWTQWTEWYSCFCGKQIRTRICRYENSYLTKGCLGKSYESRPCEVLNNCPTTSLPTQVTTSIN